MGMAAQLAYYFFLSLFPALLWRAMDKVLGWDEMATLMRPAVRYTARFPAPRIMPDIDGLIEKHQLLSRILRQRTGDDETAAIGALGEAICAVPDYNQIPALIAEALVGAGWDVTVLEARDRVGEAVCPTCQGERLGPIGRSVRLHGKGGHTSRPHLTQDLVYALGKITYSRRDLVEQIG